MRAITESNAVNSSEWRWPIDLTLYDRRPDLLPEEWRKLDELIREREVYSYRWFVRYRDDIQRFVQPIYDVLDILGSPKLRRTIVLFRLLREMHHRKSSLWAWNSTEWDEVLEANQDLHPSIYRELFTMSYLLGENSNFLAICRLRSFTLPVRIFGETTFEASSSRFTQALTGLGYAQGSITYLKTMLGYIMLMTRSPHLEDISIDLLKALHDLLGMTQHHKHGVSTVAFALFSIGLLPRRLDPLKLQPKPPSGKVPAGVLPEWFSWCKRWFDTSTQSQGARKRVYQGLIIAGRWLQANHPQVDSPAQWTREMAAEFVAAVTRMTIGEWSEIPSYRAKNVGKPLAASTKAGFCNAMNCFFANCHEWNWIPIRFDPRRSFAVPRSILAQIGPNPRIIADDIWAKLVWAGLNLTADDLPFDHTSRSSVNNPSHYPIEMVRALVITWLFGGLRKNELYRLRVGCIRWQEDNSIAEAGRVCLLDIPVNKTGTAFTKPVDGMVGEAIEIWEKVRPPMPPVVDSKTGERVHLLFFYRGKQLGKDYMNGRIIPLLCRKAGVPESDARGRITSHRARATIASQLFNAKDPMSLFELQEWLGHRSPHATQHYARITPTRLAKSYRDAAYFTQNLRTIEVLIDPEAIKSGAVANGEPWKYYDLGHGYCTYDFFEQCPHRMMCAKCAFYPPKASSDVQLLEARSHLQRMLQEIPLTEDERAATEADLEAVEKLYQQLSDVPTPAGPTPRQLQSDLEPTSAFIPLSSIGLRP